MLILRVVLIAFALVFGAVSTAFVATAAEAPKVLSIHVEGNRFVEQETVLAKMKTRVGEKLDRKLLSQDIRALHKTGYFEDVRFTGQNTDQGVKLVCVVKEFPLIATVKIEGNDEFPTKDLQLRMKLRPGRIFSKDNQVSDRNLLVKGYLKKGYYQVGVDFIATPRDDGRVDLLVKVNEGKITHVRRIRFIGNHAFSDDVLLDAIISKHSDLSSWVTDRDVFDKNRFGADAQMLQQYYMNRGYLDMAIESTQLVMSSDKEEFDLTFSLREGVQYRVASLGIEGDKVPDEATLMALVELEQGAIYSLADMQASIQALTDRVGDEGYAFATVTPLMNRNVEDRTVAISFDVEKGEEVYIERIEIFGNEKSEDQLLRRQVKQDEASRYSGSKVKRSKEALLRNPYNEDMRVSFPKGSAADKVNMKIDMTEKKSGKLAGGIGYSQQEKIIFNAKISEENLFGKGYQANLNGTYGRVTQDIQTTLTDPYFLGMNLSASISAFKRKTNPLTIQTYKTDSVGGSVGFGVPLSDEFSYSIRYSYQNVNMTLTNNIANVSLLIQAQQGKRIIGELGQTLSWDARDRAMATRSGHKQELYFGLAGVGGNKKFYEARATSSFYVSMNAEQDIVFNPTVEASVIRGYGGLDVPLWRRYSLGGIGSMRGYDSMGISLRDPATNEAIGGDKQLRGSFNLFFPVPYIRTEGVRGVAFVDAGTVWGRVNATVGGTTLNISQPFALSNMRYSAGLGFEWMSPVGPLSLAWSLPFRSKPNDLKRSFEFTLGGVF